VPVKDEFDTDTGSFLTHVNITVQQTAY